MKEENFFFVPTTTMPLIKKEEIMDEKIEKWNPKIKDQTQTLREGSKNSIDKFSLLHSIR